MEGHKKTTAEQTQMQTCCLSLPVSAESHCMLSAMHNARDLLHTKERVLVYSIFYKEKLSNSQKCSPGLWWDSEDGLTNM